MDKQSISTVRDYQQFTARNAAREVLTGLGVILDLTTSQPQTGAGTPRCTQRVRLRRG